MEVSCGSWGVQRISNLTYPSEEGVSHLPMKSGNVPVDQLCLNLENPQATNRMFILAWKLPVSKPIRADPEPGLQLRQMWEGRYI